MNQQNMMQQFFDQQQQNNMNGFTGVGYSTSQSIPSSYNSQVPVTSPFVPNNTNYRNQNGGVNRFNENEQYQLNQSAQHTQNYPYVDPRLANFDIRNRPPFDGNGLQPNMQDGYNSNLTNSKVRMNDMSYNNSIIAAMQRRRLGGVYGQGGPESEFPGPGNNFGGFTPQALQYMQQQQRYEAFQRQVQQQLSAQQLPPPGPNEYQGPNSPLPKHVTNSDSPVNPSKLKQENENNMSVTSQQENTGRISTKESPAVKPTDNKPSGKADSNKNAALLAAAAVRAAAAASSRGRSGYLSPNPLAMNHLPPGYPAVPPGYPNSNEQAPINSPFNHNVQSPEFNNIMSPSKDIKSASSPMSQRSATPRSTNAFQSYSPAPLTNETNHARPPIATTVKDSTENTEKHSPHPRPEENSVQVKSESVESKENLDDQNPMLQTKDMNTAPSDTNDGKQANKHSAPPTPMSAVSSSPPPSLQDDQDTIDGLSPSWPQTPLSPDVQKMLKARASPKQYDQLSKVYELIDDEDKRNFMDRYLAFMSVNGTPVTKLPIVGRQPLDLYKLFRSVCERGGIHEVLQQRRFCEILTALNLPTVNGVLAYMIKEQYMRYLYAYEVKAKDILLKQWNGNVQSNNKKPTNVPTISLNDTLNSNIGVKKEIPTPVKQENERSTPVRMSTPCTTSVTPTPAWNSSYSRNATNIDKQRLSYPSNLSTSQQMGMSGYPMSQDLPPAYSSYPGFQNPMMQRAPMPSYPMRPGMPNELAWGRQYPPRQGPPELFPEGLQRMPWNQQTPQRPTMSAFSSPTYPAANSKPRPQTPNSRDLNSINPKQLEQLKQEQQLKLQQYQKQQARLNHDQTSKAGVFKMSRPQNTEQKVPTTPTQAAKRELSFPPGAVEGTKPSTAKRKKTTSKDLGPVEAWRIMMSLKSGLLAECAWAIDTLNILLSDNNTITYFHLNQLPGLLDTLMDHYRRSISQLFKSFNDIEIPLFPEPSDKQNDSKTNPKTIDSNLKELWVGVCKNSKKSFSSNLACFAVSENVSELLNGGRHNWENGGADNTTHIQLSFPCQAANIRKFPSGLTYQTKVDLEKKKKLEHFKTRVSNSTENTDGRVIEASSNDNEEKSVCESNSICLGVLDDLLSHSSNDKSSISDHDETRNPIVTKVLNNLEFNIVCDRKYLEDSKEFISYLNRRLQRENRASVESEQCVVKQSSPFSNATDTELSLYNRCVALSNIFRSLSFIQGNDSELANHIGLLLIAGYSLLHKHEHMWTDHSQFKLGLDERTVTNNAFADPVDDSFHYTLHSIRENMLVMLSNIAGHVNLRTVKKDIASRIICGLLHWISCRSSEALDPMPTAPSTHALSAQRLAMETLAKMTINTSNIELVVFESSNNLLAEVGDVLIKQVAKKHPVPTREFAIILLDNLCQSQRFSEILCQRKCAVNNLVKFIFEAEKNTSNYLSSGGRVQPGLNAEDICGTSIGLLRRSVNIILSLSKLRQNRRYLVPFTDDILSLSTSQMIDTSVLALLASVLYELGV